MTLEEAQKTVDNWIKTYGVRYFSELTNMAVLTEEVGELARVISRTYGDQSFKPGEKANLADETGGRSLGLDLSGQSDRYRPDRSFSEKSGEENCPRQREDNKNNPKL